MPAQVSVHSIDLAIDRRAAEAQLMQLSGPERERARRFAHDRDRHRYVAAHAGLRRILGEWLKEPPADVRLQAEIHHKPTLLDHPEVHFNLSHGDDVGLVAISTHGPVGVDVERLRSLPDMAAVADSVFCAAERAAWRSVPEALSVRAFFNGWTRKEALIKATGEGFRANLQALCVSLLPDEQPRVLAAPPSVEAPWQLQQLEPQPGYVGAVAMRCAVPFEVRVHAD
ncbi:MAG: 4'-phosphopantetheinyl transferase superfamily protein [Gammaproteobacteria bacterium]